MTRERITLVAAALALTAGLTGCTSLTTSTKSDPAELPNVGIAGYEDVTARLDYELSTAETPVSKFSLSNPDYVSRALHAIAVRADSCMKKAGFPATASQQDWSPFVPEEDRTYGLWNVTYASKYGVELAPEAGPPPVNVIDMGVDQGNQYATCSDAARESLIDELLWSQDLNIDTQIRRRAYESVIASDKGKAAEADWQACMEDRGIVLDPADGRPVQQYQARGKEAEIAAMVVEAECARSTNAAQTLYDLQARYEAALIDAQSAQIQAFIDRRNEVITVFEDAIAGR